MLPLRKSAPGKVLPNEQRGAGCRSNVLDVSAHGVLGRCVSNGGAKPDVKQRSANASTERMSAQGRPIDCGAVACTQGSQACGGAAKSASLRGCRASLDPALAEHNQRLLRKRGTGGQKSGGPLVQGGFSQFSHCVLTAAAVQHNAHNLRTPKHGSRYRYDLTAAAVQHNARAHTLRTPSTGATITMDGGLAVSRPVHTQAVNRQNVGEEEAPS